jgi:hypothetical protein
VMDVPPEELAAFAPEELGTIDDALTATAD